jgi:hypothetical protein
MRISGGHLRRVAVAAAASVGLASAVLTSGAFSIAATTAPAQPVYANSGGSTSWDPIANPKSSAAPSPDYSDACWTQGANAPACVSTELAAINVQHAAEHIPAMKLPANFSALGSDLQLLVITNQERVDRGLPALAGLNKQLTSAASNGAKSNTDPVFTGPPSGTKRWYGAASNWAYDFGPLGSDYDWMYNDGVGSGNLDCTASNHSGCWGHRENILSVIPGQKDVLGAAQVGTTAGGHLQSDATIVVGLTGHPKLYGKGLGA